MYYFNTLKILKQLKGEWISSTQLFSDYVEEFGYGNKVNFTKALSKLRRRDDIDWKKEGRTYFYKYINLANN